MRSITDPPDGSAATPFDRIAAIVVTFRPTPEKLSALVDSVLPQVHKVIIVDNGSTDQRDYLCELAETRGCDLLPLDTNVGVAAGHNLGVARARELKAGAVLLLDQDSLPAPDMVGVLRRALTDLTRDGKLVAAAGPCHVDERTGAQSPFIRFGYLRNQHLYCDGNRTGPISCDHLITSGSLIPLASLEAVGVLDEGLFVDNVDTEWCFRALAKGYQLFGVCSAVMSHGVGDALMNTWITGSRGVVVHSPLRLYYITRNHILLYGRTYTPPRWILQDFPRLLFKAVLFATTIPPRRSNMSMIWKGLRDGARGRTGAYVL